MTKGHKYYLFHKPYGVLSQFTKEVASHITLADFVKVESDVYPVGRLDKDSEGLLLLTNDNKLKTTLLSPKSKKIKTYMAQLDGDITKEAIAQLAKGVKIKVNGKKYQTLPAEARKVKKFKIPARVPPVRYRAEIPTSWVEIKIHEGKNRQIRKMCAQVGFPVLRLIRTAIGPISHTLEDGQLVELKKSEVAKI